MMDRNTDTLGLAYSEAENSLKTLAFWYDTLDTKVVAVFGVSSVMGAVAPMLTDVKLSMPGILPWLLALLAWGTAAVFCFVALKPKDYRLDPNPKVLLNEAWMTLGPQDYRFFRLEDMAKSYAVNREAYRTKLRAFNVAVVATSVEVLGLALALALRP